MSEASIRIRLLAALFIGMTLTRSVVRAQEPPRSWVSVTPLRKSPKALAWLQDGDRKLVGRLDRIWSKGSPHDVARLFRSPSRPTHLELLARVRSSQMGGACVRQSRILSKEVATPYSALLLETRFSYPRGDGARIPSPVLTHELLVYKEGAAGPDSIYLVETGLKSLRQVGGILSDGSGPYSGLCISPSTSFACGACNYRLSMPQGTPWAIFVRPSAVSGLLESVELLSLESDLGFELSIVPVHRTGLAPEQRSKRLLGFLDEGVKVLGSCSGKVSSEIHRQKTDLFGLEGWSQTVLLRNTHLGRRFYKLYGLNGASLDYMISIHGAIDQLEKKSLVSSLSDCFELLDPKRKDGEAFDILQRLHGGEGHFENHNYIVKKLGVEIRGPKGWNRFTQVGNTRFMGGFDCPSSGSVIYLSGIERPGGSWDKKSVAAWAVEWIRREKEMHGTFHNGRLSKVSVAGTSGFEFDFDYTVSPDKPDLRARGFLAMFPQGSTLVIVLAIAQPVEDQKKIMATLEKCLSGMHFR